MNAWRKSGRGVNDQNCVEVCRGMEHLPDSKNPAGPIRRGDMPAFLKTIRTGRLGRLVSIENVIIATLRPDKGSLDRVGRSGFPSR